MPAPASYGRVIVAAPASPFRSRVGSVLERADFEVGAVGSSDGLIRACTAQAPDVVLVAMNLPADGGIVTTGRVCGVAPGIRVVVCMDQPDGDAAIAALRAGARGILASDVAPAALIRSIKQVVAGETWLPRHLVGPVIDELRNDHAMNRAQHYVFVLTRREREVLALVAAGFGNREIATRLGIADSTAKRHVQNVLEKLAVPSRAAAARVYGSTGARIEPSANG